VETGIVLTSAEECARRVLPVYVAALTRDDFWAADIAARVRAVGELWARSGGRLDDVLNALNVMAGELVDATLRSRRAAGKRCSTLRRYGDVCGRVAVELVGGFYEGTQDNQTSPACAAVELAEPAADIEIGADAAVVAAFAVDEGSAEVVASSFHRLLGPAGVFVVQGDRGHAFLWSKTETEAVHECETVVAGLRGPRARVAVVPAAGDDESDGRARASDLLDIVTALDLPPGVYRREDVLVEYAAARSPVSARVLCRLIAPVMAVDVLRTTMAALIAEGGNRTYAAERLFIHRSTIDYRLSRIEQLTGHCPLTTRGLSILTAAYALSASAAQNNEALAAGG
jgi:hypothetical protein